MIDEYDEPGSLEIRRLLHERVRDLHPDVLSRASHATRLGRQLRRRRRMAMSSAGVAGVAAVGVVGVQLFTPGTAPVRQAPVAAAPTQAPQTSSCGSRADQLRQLDAPRALEGVRLRAEMTRMKVGPKTMGTGAGPGLDLRSVTPVLPLTSDGPRVYGLPQSLRPVLTSLSCGSFKAPAPKPQRLPVSLQAPGWSCQPPGDDKFLCTSGRESALVVVRPAQYHHDYLTNPDKAAPGQYVSEVHGGVFATIESQTPGVAQALSAHLVWKG